MSEAELVDPGRRAYRGERMGRWLTVSLATKGRLIAAGVEGRQRHTSGRSEATLCLNRRRARLRGVGQRLPNATTFSVLGSHHCAHASIIARRFSRASPRR
jgi:hypothetical protein